MKGHKDVVALLLEKGANTKEKTNVRCKSILKSLTATTVTALDMQRGKTAIDVAVTSEIRAVLSEHISQPPTLQQATNEPPQTCVVCMSEQREVLLLPCRMLVLCRACSQRIGPAGGRNTKCPVCRVNVQSMLTIYMP